jgi:hypothetical protein
MFCGNCGLRNSSDAAVCRGCGHPLPLSPTVEAPPDREPDGTAPATGGIAPPSPPAPHRRGKPATPAIVAGMIAVVAIVLVGLAVKGSAPRRTTASSTPTVTPGGTSVTPPIEPSTTDVAALLPPFHNELKRLVAPRSGEPPALLVASSPRQDQPRPVTFTLIEWDRTAYRVADHVDIDCGYLETLQVDEDQAVFLGCTGGASAHSAWALLPDRLKITVLPSAAPNDQHGGWLIASFKTLARPQQPDDLILTARSCDPDCASGKNITYTLAWDGTFRLWNLVECAPDGGAPRRYQTFNGSVSDLTYHGCPT